MSIAPSEPALALSSIDASETAVETIDIHRARVHNLKDVSLSLPRDAMIVFSGVSGSGKSSLAFDTIFAEGQRRYVESLSTYARQFIEQFEKPDVESIDGLSPAIAIDQKTSSRSPRSTVGTVTEILDYLRVLYARMGTPHCPQCGDPIVPQSAAQIVTQLWQLPEGTRIQIMAPMVRGRKGEYPTLFQQLRKEGLARVRVDGEMLLLEELPDTYRLVRSKVHTIEAVIDRIVLKNNLSPTSPGANAPPSPQQEGEEMKDPLYTRLEAAVENALKKSEGFVVVHTQSLDDTTPSERMLSEHLACARCQGSEEEPSSSKKRKGDSEPLIQFDELAPRMFSFNSPYGACPACEGLGVRYQLSAGKIIVNPDKSLADGAIPAINRFLGRYTESYLSLISRQTGLPSSRFETAWNDLRDTEQEVVLHGGQIDRAEEGKPSGRVKKTSRERFGRFAKQQKELEEGFLDWSEALMQDIFDPDATFEGVLALLNTLTKQGKDRQKDYLEAYLDELPCDACHGARLKPSALAVTLGTAFPSPLPLKGEGGPQDRVRGKEGVSPLNIHQLGELSIEDARGFVGQLHGMLTPQKWTIGRQAINEVSDRLQFLLDVGLDYLTLNRKSASLSGGESQRIRLATQIGSQLSGVLYVLDEPSIGLHPHNNHQLIETLLKLRDQGNTLIVVEHDEDTIRAADWMVDIGPAAGVHGGRLVAQGTPQQVMDNPDSLTGQYLSGKRAIAVPEAPRPGNSKTLVLRNATRHNLRDLDITIPLGQLVVVTGMSGSGKSTMVFDLLYPALAHHFRRHQSFPDGLGRIEGLEHLDKFIDIDQSPIGRTSRSNPATYTGLFDPIRQVFAATELAKMRGYGPGRFSFNVKQGRCEACNGDGETVLEMNFLPDVHQTCPVCNGQRYNPETLEVRYKGKTIAEVLAMSVEEARAHFSEQPRIENMLGVLCDVGLDYIHLGQAATTLSGGEAQRLKLATEFCRRGTGNTLYLLDEPTVGLHWKDLENLIKILGGLVDQGNTVIVIEHNLDLIKVADHIIDMGPMGGRHGGEIVAQGTPQEIAACESSLTGQFLKRYVH